METKNIEIKEEIVSVVVERSLDELVDETILWMFKDDGKGKVYQSNVKKVKRNSRGVLLKVGNHDSDSDEWVFLQDIEIVDFL